MDRLRFGTGGVPMAAKDRGIVSGIEKLKELGLGNMEVEFVYGVKMKPEEAKAVGQAALENDIVLTAHAPYYVSLASEEPQKRGASRSYLLTTAKRCQEMGAKSFTFHAAAYTKRDQKEVFAVVKEQLQKLKLQMVEEGIEGVIIRPELTGKPWQLGDLDELVQLSQQIEGVLPCIDFAHAYARSGGKINSYEEFHRILQTLEKELGKEILSNMHIHMSGIKYGDKGEKEHLPLQESDFRWQEVIRALKAFNVKGVVVCESPILEEDSLRMKEFWEGLK
jgi:deoxyribonuclease IV